MDNSRMDPVQRFRPVRYTRDSGMALIVVLLLLLLVSAIGLGMVYMSNTESSINANYRDSQLAFFAMRAGLEEARDRMRTNSPWPIAPPTTMPGNPNSIVYIINPAAGEVVDPKLGTNAYFDDEFCHESFPADGLANPGANIPCPAGSPPPAGSVAAYVNSITPSTGTASSLKYKWARITLKQNGTFATAPAQYVDSTAPATDQVCYQSLSGQEIPISKVITGPGPFPYPSCTAAVTAGQDASPVYLVTTLAVTPTASRRIGQYEMAALHIATPPVSLGLDGPAPVFNPASSSNNFFINGTDDNNGYANPPGCASTGKTIPSITVYNPGDVPGISNATKGPPDRSNNFQGCTTTAPCSPGSPTYGTPSVASGGTTTFAGEWSSPAQLDNVVQSIANMADVTYPAGGGTCGIGGVGGAGCSPAGPLGSDANPQITFVNGDFSMGNQSGAGVLVVTGTLSFSGNSAFDGLVLVIGQGNLSISGGGNGGFNGSLFLAKTHSSAAPFPELGALQSPTIGINGGGTAYVQYNSCWAGIGNGERYVPIAIREEMY